MDGASNGADFSASRVHPGKRNIQATRHYGGAQPPFPCDSCVLLHPGIPVGVDMDGLRTHEPGLLNPCSAHLDRPVVRRVGDIPLLLYSLSRGEEGGHSPPWTCKSSSSGPARKAIYAASASTPSPQAMGCLICFSKWARHSSSRGST